MRRGTVMQAVKSELITVLYWRRIAAVRVSSRSDISDFIRDWKLSGE